MSCFPFQSKVIFLCFRVIARDYSWLGPVEQIVKSCCFFFVFFFLLSMPLPKSSFPNVVYGTVFLMALPSGLEVFFPALVLSFGVTVTDEFAFCLV